MTEPKANWSQEILDLYSTGQFDVEVASHLKVPLREFHKQAQDNAAFGRLVEYGRTLCEAYWVSQAKRNLNNKTFNGTTWMFVMKNQFNWADKSESLQAGESNNVNLDELRQRLTKEMARFAKQNQPELEKSFAQMAEAAKNE